MIEDYHEWTSCEANGCLFEFVASWPSGPDGEWTELRKCTDCGQEYEVDHDG